MKTEIVGGPFVDDPLHLAEPSLAPTVSHPHLSFSLPECIALQYSTIKRLPGECDIYSTARESALYFI